MTEFSFHQLFGFNLPPFRYQHSSLTTMSSAIFTKQKDHMMHFPETSATVCLTVKSLENLNSHATSNLHNLSTKFNPHRVSLAPM